MKIDWTITGYAPFQVTVQEDSVWKVIYFKWLRLPFFHRSNFRDFTIYHDTRFVSAHLWRPKKVFFDEGKLCWNFLELFHYCYKTLLEFPPWRDCFQLSLSIDPQESYTSMHPFTFHSDLPSFCCQCLSFPLMSAQLIQRFLALPNYL